MLLQNIYLLVSTLKLETEFPGESEALQVTALVVFSVQGRNYIEARRGNCLRGGNCLLVLWPAVYRLSSISMTCVQNGLLNYKNSSPECTKNRYFETKNGKNF